MQLNQAAIIQHDPQQYAISGVIDFSTAPDIMLQASDFFKSHKKSTTATGTDVTVDLSKITASNSAGLSLMLEMVGQAQNNNIELHFTNLPETLLTIAKAYGVEDEIRDFT